MSIADPADHAVRGVADAEERRAVAEPEVIRMRRIDLDEALVRGAAHGERPAGCRNGWEHLQARVPDVVADRVGPARPGRGLRRESDAPGPAPVVETVGGQCLAAVGELRLDVDVGERVGVVALRNGRWSARSRMRRSAESSRRSSARPAG